MYSFIQKDLMVQIKVLLVSSLGREPKHSIKIRGKIILNLILRLSHQIFYLVFIYS